MADKNFVMGALNQRQNKKVREGNEKVFQASITNIEKKHGKNSRINLRWSLFRSNDEQKASRSTWK